jgi:FtsP/CotA-like multicopper oxidase with cupredoxin domain
MAGLGQNIGTNFAMRARMNGNAVYDGQAVNIWYFDYDASNMGFMNDRHLPSAHIEPIEGELTRIEFVNQSSMPHTIHLHGLDVDQANDGVPQTSAVVPPLGSFTYEFVAPHAGTYHYHCHVDTIVHYHRGMGGAIVVRPPDGATDRAWDGGPTFDEEVLWHLQTFDMAWKNELASSAQTARHRPGVFLLNGLQTADATADPFTRVDLAVGQTAYIRLLNHAYQWARVSLGGLPFQVVATDGRPMLQVPTVESWELGPGERYDLLLDTTTPAAVTAAIDYLDDYSGQLLGSVGTEIVVS